MPSQIALSKAQRNAIKNLVPVSIVHTLIKEMEQLQPTGDITVGEARRKVDVASGVIDQPPPDSPSEANRRQVREGQARMADGHLDAKTLSQF